MSSAHECFGVVARTGRVQVAGSFPVSSYRSGEIFGQLRVWYEVLVPAGQNSLYRRRMSRSRWWGYPFGIRVRLAVAIVLTAAIPVAGAVILARSLVQQASERAFVPEIRTHLDGALAVYGELAQQTKKAMRLEARLIAQNPSLVGAANARDAERAESLLREELAANSGIVSLELYDAGGQALATVRREQPLNEQKELSLTVEIEVSSASTAESQVARAEAETRGARTMAERSTDAALLSVQMAANKEPFEQFSQLGEFIEAYASLARRREVDERTYVLAFAVLLLGTIIIAVTVGSWLARTVSTRIGALAVAAAEVGRGDLSVRVPEHPPDEVGQLGQAFNQMLAEVEGSRSRIEYLSRLASWQEMARRLAHEIKNPLTPIQLAVQEVHQRFSNLPERDREILDVALEIVEAEVLTLRRLVKEFSEFARLPQSERQPMPLREFLTDLQTEMQLAPLECLGLERESYPQPALEWQLPADPMPIRLDPQMMRRALLNLIRNAVQASRGRERVSISVRVSSNSRYLLQIEDDGPGIEPQVREHLFEPYVTTKDDGTGLGLAIVKKIVMDHEGTITAEAGERGGACFLIRLPRAPSER